MMNLLNLRKSSVATTTDSAKQEKACSGSMFCGGANDCIVVGPTASSHPYQPTFSYNYQVAELEKEVQKQKELKNLYRTRFDKTQDYLRNCLQIAQEKGFLDIIIDNKNNNEENDNDLQALVSSCVLQVCTVGPQIPPPIMLNHSDLDDLIHQAKTNGWYTDPSEVELLDKVGQGSTAEIYKATWRGLDVAVKCIYPDFFESNKDGLNFFAQEVDTLSRQRHPYVLHLMGACLYPPNHAWIVTEFLDMTLKDWLHGTGPRKKTRTIPLPSFKERLAKGMEIAQAMQYLHEHRPKVLHRDLKPSNIFLDENRHVRVADFGHARLLKEEEKALTGETGTYVYMAPEVIRCEPYNEKCDVYSFAVILNELITGNPPFVETDFGPSRIAMEVAEGRLRPALPKDDFEVFKEIIQLINLSWDGDSNRRPSFAYISSTLKDQSWIPQQQPRQSPQVQPHPPQC